MTLSTEATRKPLGHDSSLHADGRAGEPRLPVVRHGASMWFPCPIGTHLAPFGRSFAASLLCLFVWPNYAPDPPATCNCMYCVGGGGAALPATKTGNSHGRGTLPRGASQFGGENCRAPHTSRLTARIQGSRHEGLTAKLAAHADLSLACEGPDQYVP